MSKKGINEHDSTKNMLDIIRENGNSLKNLLEDNSIFDKPDTAQDDGEIGPEGETGDKSQMEPDDGDDAIKLQGMELEEENSKLTEIDSTIDIESFTIYPDAKNAVMAGTIGSLNDLQFYFSLTESNGVFVTVDNLQLTKDAVAILNKLEGYYQNWVDEWAEKVRREYKSGSNMDGTLNTYDYE